MAKYYGKVGYKTTAETSKGVWEPTIEDKFYQGEIIRDSRRNQNGTAIIDGINISNVISIIGDPYSYENFFNIVYVNWMGVNWKVSNIEVQYPRLLLTLGGIYNG